MNSNKKATKIVGVLFILAAVTAIVGLNLYNPILILALPVAANEMILAVWLIVKGFNESANQKGQNYLPF